MIIEDEEVLKETRRSSDAEREKTTGSTPVSPRRREHQPQHHHHQGLSSSFEDEMMKKAGGWWWWVVVVSGATTAAAEISRTSSGWENEGGARVVVGDGFSAIGRHDPGGSINSRTRTNATESVVFDFGRRYEIGSLRGRARIWIRRARPRGRINRR